MLLEYRRKLWRRLFYPFNPADSATDPTMAHVGRYISTRMRSYEHFKHWSIYSVTYVKLLSSVARTESCVPAGRIYTTTQSSQRRIRRKKHRRCSTDSWVDQACKYLPSLSAAGSPMVVMWVMVSWNYQRAR
jgi:hypothetical protein